MNIDAVRDDGALLVSAGGRGAAIVSADGEVWGTSLGAALARGNWDDPAPDDVVPQSARATVAEVIATMDRELGPSLLTTAPLETGSNTNLTAAAEVHTGAMVALLPSMEDASRIVVDGGEPVDQLHLTLLYLGEGALIPPEVRGEIIDACARWAENLPTIIAKAFSVNMFNPNGEEPCVVLGVSGGLLDNVHNVITQSVDAVLQHSGVPYPEQHRPWIPHITLVYTDDAELNAFADKLGPITFDHIRVTFAGDVYDIPLSAVTVTAAAFKFDLK